MKTKKYLICNIVCDEKFIDGAIECLDFYSEKWTNKWIICNLKGRKLNFIKRHSDRVQNVDENKVINFLIDNKFDAVILHSFGVISPAVIANIPLGIKVFWFGWGYDIYNYPKQRPFLKWNLYKPLTAKYLRSSLYKKGRSLASKLLFTLKGNGRVYKRALNRVDYFAGIIEFEYDLLKSNPNFRAQKVSFAYSSSLGVTSYENFEKYDGLNILIGNSAADTNNHLDLLERLKLLDISNRKIILPLSYAGTEKYVADVIKAYKRFFGDNVIALTSFMPFEQYKKYILSCNVAIFFMARQQAMGNINTALKYGCKVFLSEENPVYQYYKNSGISVYSIEKELSNEHISIELTDAEIDNNRFLLKNRYEYKSYLNKLETIYQAIKE